MQRDFERMRKNRLPLVLTILLLGILLAACSNASAVNSWAGASLSDPTVFYAGSTQVFALKNENGNIIWSYPEKVSAGRIFLAAPVVVDEQVIVGDYAGQLTSLSIRDGKENWSFTGATGRYVDSPLIVDGMIIAPNSDHHLYALDLQGSLKWSFAAGHSFWTQPVSDGKTVFAGSLDHNLYAVDLKSGELVWKIDLGASEVGRIAINEGILYQGTLSGNMNAIDATTGKLIWSQKLDAGLWSAPVVVDGKLFFGDQTSKIYVLEASNGNILQSIEIGSAVIGSGAEITDGVLFGTEKGELVMIGLDGTKKWTRTVDGKLYSNLVTDGQLVLVPVVGGDKQLVAFDVNGNEVWYFAGK